MLTSLLSFLSKGGFWFHKEGGIRGDKGQGSERMICALFLESKGSNAENNMKKESHKIGEITMLPAGGMLVRCRFHCDKTLSHHFVVSLQRWRRKNQGGGEGLSLRANLVSG